MKINLSNYEVLPNLVQGKVIALNCPYGKQLDLTINGKKISLLTVGRYTVLSDGPINPENYDILETSQYTVLINAKYGPVVKAVKDYLNAKQTSIINELTKYINDNKPVTYKVGDKIHLKDKMGMYVIHDIQDNSVIITCKKWHYNPKESDKYRVITIDQIKCLAGGYENFKP